MGPDGTCFFFGTHDFETSQLKKEVERLKKHREELFAILLDEVARNTKLTPFQKTEVIMKATAKLA